MPRFLVVLPFLFSVSASATVPQEVRDINTDLVAFARSLDRLAAVEEQKEQMFSQALLGALSADSGITQKKVDILTNEGTLKDCAKYFEDNDPEMPRHIVVAYEGPQCPLLLKAVIDVVQVNPQVIEVSGMINVKILSQSLQNELSVEELVMPLKVRIDVFQDAMGFRIIANLDMSMEAKSLQSGTTSITNHSVMEFGFGPTGMYGKSDSTEAYVSKDFNVVFRTESGSDPQGQPMEKYYINGVEVEKAEYLKQHQRIPAMGFEQKVPLSSPQICQVKTYDAGAVSIEELRAQIKDGRIQSLPSKEVIPLPLISETGELVSPLDLDGKSYELQLDVSQDAIRLVLVDATTQEPLGKLTGLLDKKFDIARQIGPRHVRLTCQAQ